MAELARMFAHSDEAHATRKGNSRSFEAARQREIILIERGESARIIPRV